MTSYDFSTVLLNITPFQLTESVDEAAAQEVTQLISGSLIYRLYESLIESEYNMDAVTAQLEALYDADQHFGLVYFMFILCDAVNVALPERFSETAANPALLPYLADALVADWLDFHEDYEG